jgi:hypothetical protein
MLEILVRRFVDYQQLRTEADLISMREKIVIPGKEDVVDEVFTAIRSYRPKPKSFLSPIWRRIYTKPITQIRRLLSKKQVEQKTNR